MFYSPMLDDICIAEQVEGWGSKPGIWNDTNKDLFIYLFFLQMCISKKYFVKYLNLGSNTKSTV